MEDEGGTAQIHLTVGDLAAREKVSKETVYHWNKTGTGPRYLKVGKHVRYRLRDVKAWEHSLIVERHAGGAA